MTTQKVNHQYTSELSQYSVIDDEFLRESMERFPNTRLYQKNTYRANILKLNKAVFAWEDTKRPSRKAMFRRPEGLLMAEVENGTVNFVLVSDNEEGLTLLGRHMFDYVPPAKKKATDQVEVVFWADASPNPMATRRTLNMPAWEEIKDNYPGKVQGGIERMMAGDWRPGSSGKLILWHGEPGTGKTTAIRALTRAWSGWCEPYYITDGEAFFGDHAAYMLNVLLGNAADEYDYETDQMVLSEKKWRLLVLEDMGELLAVDAREKTGAALGRFLNAVDGMIGQGRNIIVLVTTNEPLKKLHPAVSRAGRCMSNIEFSELDGDEVEAWVNSHGYTGGYTYPAKLSDLYALLNDSDTIEVKKDREKVGFA